MKEGDIDLSQGEARREFSEKQQSDYERLKADEVLTLKECVNIDHMVSAQMSRPAQKGSPVKPTQAPPTQGRWNALSLYWFISLVNNLMSGYYFLSCLFVVFCPYVDMFVGGAAVHRPSSDFPVSYQMAAPLNEAELTALLMASPLYQKLEQLKKTVAGGALSGSNKQMSMGGYYNI